MPAVTLMGISVCRFIYDIIGRRMINNNKNKIPTIHELLPSLKPVSQETIKANSRSRLERIFASSPKTEGKYRYLFLLALLPTILLMYSAVKKTLLIPRSDYQQHIIRVSDIRSDPGIGRYSSPSTWAVGSGIPSKFCSKTTISIIDPVGKNMAASGTVTAYVYKNDKVSGDFCIAHLLTPFSSVYAGFIILAGIISVALVAYQFRSVRSRVHENSVLYQVFIIATIIACMALFAIYLMFIFISL